MESVLIYLTYEDVLPGKSKAIGISGALFKPFLSRVILAQKIFGGKNPSGNEDNRSLFYSLKGNDLAT